jgi:hypothetical protein
MKLTLLRTSALIALFAFPALAQTPAQPAQTRIRGLVYSFNGQTLVVKIPDNMTETVTIPADLKILANVRTSLADIKPGEFVGSAAAKGPDGKLYAEEVHVFAEFQRGTGEGHRPMGPDPNAASSTINGTVAPAERTMTNGTVSAASGSGTRTLKIRYKEGEQEIIVKPDTPIITFIVADRSLLKPGAAVAVVAVEENGGLVARQVTAEKDGLKPR